MMRRRNYCHLEAILPSPTKNLSVWSRSLGSTEVRTYLTNAILIEQSSKFRREQINIYAPEFHDVVNHILNLDFYIMTCIELF